MRGSLGIMGMLTDQRLGEEIESAARDNIDPDTINSACKTFLCVLPY